MKTSVKLSGIVAALMLAVSGAAMSAEQVSPYVHSSDGKIVKSGYGLCYRTGFWTPALAQASGDGCNCDADILGEACVEPAPVVEKAPEKVTLSADTLFAYNKADLKAEGEAALDELVSKIAGVDVEVIVTTGYADRIGSDKFNLELSQRRAESVKAYLVSKGVDASLIQAEGRGEADPVVNCPDPTRNGEIKNFRQLVQCLAPNRRAVVEVSGTRPAE